MANILTKTLTKSDITNTWSELCLNNWPDGVLIGVKKQFDRPANQKNGLEGKLVPSNIGIHKLISSVIRLKYTQNIEQPSEVSEVLKFI